MLARIQPPNCGATNSAIATDSEQSSTVGSDSDDSEWFYKAAQDLLGKDAGYALHLVTKLPDGSCYKYVAHDKAHRRKPPGYLVRRLLRSGHGWQWLCAAMEGSDAPWFEEVKRARRIADAIDKADQL